ncbi:hypothetical protein MRX96_018656 [Rhipicephalus microplus]
MKNKTKKKLNDNRRFRRHRRIPVQEDARAVNASESGSESTAAAREAGTRPTAIRACAGRRRLRFNKLAATQPPLTILGKKNAATTTTPVRTAVLPQRCHGS